MYLPNCRIKLNGMKLSDTCQRSIEVLMQSLANKSPSDSFLSFCLVSGENDVNAFLSITSKSGEFHSSHHGNEPISVVKKLSKDLHSQLKLWVERRVF